mmetsp:Transcript_17016/g.28701  ORF Transcript_17016/g.28701 Transcript_17016/m.28701 type:complete len:535 (+) Transcript_17016:177-1781(+)|eukprot:CAMPEP_0198205450 /NCGR_PEP_ID=MMETSP1445-20131203/9002_1 /TAXON_ID=36898 /ORGANISM="Pyramimonas sp., Strain CCMP2087" /LENGTH=534 /DNA_ID=CAMNT_0043877777 /DNA_START=126 /DNA_END=1730 /DNA_ORIENTATION=+
MAGNEAVGAVGASIHKKKKSKPIPSTAEQQEAKKLESLLFGADDALDDFGQETEADVSIAALVRSAALPRHEASEAGSAPSDAIEDTKPKPAWVDPDDDEVVVEVAKKSRTRKLRRNEEEETLEGGEYVERLRAEHQRLNPRTNWAELASERRARKRRQVALNGGHGSDSEEEEEEEDDEELITASTRTAGRLTKSSAVGGRLPRGELQVSRLKDANQMEPSKAVVRSVQFHLNGQLLLTAGLDKSLRLFQIDGSRNPKVQTVFLEDMPIHTARFSGDGRQVIMSGRRRHFYVYDLGGGQVERVHGVFGREEKSFEGFAAAPEGAHQPMVAFYGNEGHIPLVSLKTRQAVGHLKMNGSVRSAAFSSDGLQLLSSGSDGTMYVWDVRTMKCLTRAVDEGCLNATALASSADGSLVASGSDSGVVNIYKHGSLFGPGGGGALTPSPVRSLMNLTTAIDNLCFSPDTQMLALSSRMKKDSLRLVHLPSYTVFSNWPTSGTPLHMVTSMDFSPGGGYMAIGNAKGKVLLYRMHHYGRA